MNRYQQGGQVDPQQIMQQIAEMFQQLPPEAQQQLLQGLAQMMQQGAPQEEAPATAEEVPMEEAQAVMRMGGFRPQSAYDMYR